jgi:hypothetical protein
MFGLEDERYELWQAEVKKNKKLEKVILHQDKIFARIEDIASQRRLGLITEKDFAQELYFAVALRGERGLPK